MEESRNLTTEEKASYEKLPVPFGIFSVHKTSFELLVISDGFCSLFGAERSAFGASCKEILKRHIHPDDYEKFRPDIQRACLQPNGEYSAVYRIRANETDYRWISVKGCVQQQEDGSYFLYVYFTDVHDETQLQREKVLESRRTEVLLSDILSTTKTAIFWKDADRRFLGANRAFLDYYGFPDESAILGKNDEDMGWHSDPDPFRRDEIRVLKNGVSTYHVHGRCLVNGETREITASKSPLIIDGKTMGLVGTFEDVTLETTQKKEIQRLNEELGKQLLSRDLLMSISEVAIVRISLADFTFIEYNDSMCRMAGITRRQCENRYGRRIESYFTGKYRIELENLKKSIEKAIEEEKRQFTVNMRVPSVRGPIWIGGAVSFADYDPTTKRPAAMNVVYREITDIIEAQKKLELADAEIQKAAAIELQNQKLRAMIDSVPSGLGALRITNGIRAGEMQINRYFTERIDVRTGEESLVNLDAFIDCVYPEDRQRCIRDFEEFLVSKELTTRQYRFRTRQGDVQWLSVRGIIAHLSENVEIAYFIYTNISEIKLAEEKLRESERFYAEVVRAAKLSTWDYDIANHTIRMSDDRFTSRKSSVIGLPRVITNVPDSLAADISEEDRPAFFDMYRKVEMGRNASCEI